MLRVQRRVMRVVRDMENKVYEALWKNEDCVAWKRRPKKDISFQGLKSCCEGKGTTLFPRSMKSVIHNIKI